MSALLTATETRSGFRPDHAADVSQTPTPSLLVATHRAPLSLRQSLVLLAVDEDEGSLGFIVNRARSAECPEFNTGWVDVRPFEGGPANPESCWVVFDTRRGNVIPGDSHALSSDIAVTACPELFARIRNGHASTSFLHLRGYVEWPPFALEEELERGNWLRIDADARILFDVPPARRWSDALHTLGVEPSLLDELRCIDA